MSLFLLCQKNQIARVIIKYSTVQTGAKTQSGGLKFDFTSCEYHGSLKLIVAIPPINDAEYVAIARIIKDKILFFIIMVLYINSI